MSVTLDDVSYTYRSYNTTIAPALRGVSLNIGDEEAVAILGPSGSGRSTLLLHLNGLLKPDAGRVLLEGADINAPGVDLVGIRRRVGLLMQNPDEQLFGASVSADVGFGPEQAGLPPSEVDERVAQALRSVGM